MNWKPLADAHRHEPAERCILAPLSARAYHRILEANSPAGSARSADLVGSEAIQPAHLAEALQYRPRVMMG